MTALEAYQWMLRICAIGIAIDALEQFVRRARYADGGLFGWSVLRHRLDRAPRFVRGLADAACAGVARPMCVLAIRVAAAAAVGASAPGSTEFALALSVLLATQLYHFLRCVGIGTYGADQMNLVIIGAAWLAIVIDGTGDGLRAGLWFVAAQSCLSYAVNGGAKVASASWRSGRAFSAVFSTYTNGDPRLYRAFAPRPRLARVMCWATMLWECGFPLVLVVPEPVRIALLVSGVLFHLSIAATMGIHLFVWAFIAPYAAIWVVTR